MLRSFSERVDYLIAHGYREDVAKVIAQNMTDADYFSPVHHVEHLQTKLAPGRFEIEIAYHSVIRV